MAWGGGTYVLSDYTVILITVNFYILLMRQTQLTFINAMGLFWEQRWKAIIESLLNLIFSVIFTFTFHLGLNGILLGTLASSLLTVVWYEPFVIYKSGLSKPYGRYLLLLGKQWVFYVLGLVFVAILGHFVFSKVDNWLMLSFSSLMTFVSLLLMFIVGTFRSPYFKRLYGLIRRLFNRFSNT